MYHHTLQVSKKHDKKKDKVPEQKIEKPAKPIATVKKSEARATNFDRLITAISHSIIPFLSRYGHHEITFTIAKQLLLFVEILPVGNYWKYVTE